MNVESTRGGWEGWNTARIGCGWVLVAGLTGALLTVGTAEAQSLADVARREADRRAALEKSSPVLTNADLPASAAVESGTSSVASSEATASDENVSAAASDDETPAAGKKAEAQTDDEAGWRARAEQVNRALADARAKHRQLRALSDRLALEMQASNPEIVARATREREDLRGSLAEARAAEDEAFAARQALEQEARAAGVPPAWLQ